MTIVKLGRRGQLSIPKGVLDALKLEGESWLMVETTSDGAIVLRPAAIAPMELYDDAQIEAFSREDALTPELAKQLAVARSSKS